MNGSNFYFKVLRNIWSSGMALSMYLSLHRCETSFPSTQVLTRYAISRRKMEKFAVVTFSEIWLHLYERVANSETSLILILNRILFILIFSTTWKWLSTWINFCAECWSGRFISLLCCEPAVCTCLVSMYLLNLSNVTKRTTLPNFHAFPKET